VFFPSDALVFGRLLLSHSEPNCHLVTIKDQKHIGRKKNHTAGEQRKDQNPKIKRKIEKEDDKDFGVLPIVFLFTFLFLLIGFWSFPVL
jgi:hypothetical protein